MPMGKYDVKKTYKMLTNLLPFFQRKLSISDFIDGLVDFNESMDLYIEPLDLNKVKNFARLMELEDNSKCAGCKHNIKRYDEDGDTVDCEHLAKDCSNFWWEPTKEFLAKLEEI